MAFQCGACCTKGGDPNEAIDAAPAARVDSDEGLKKVASNPKVEASVPAHLSIAAGTKFPDTAPALRSSWAAVEGIGLQEVGVLFFRRIFEIAPGALQLFSFKDVPKDKLYDHPKLKNHALAVMKTVGTAVSMLDDVPNLLPVLEGLGKKHVGYGVQPEHYEVVGQALLDTLATGLGKDFSEPLKAAWAEIYGVVSSTMIKGATEQA
uniref:Globin domain-containing protein n=1 Tax=Zooxanthella nutricula TaxID=1333877 RepID=A0A7S2IQR5_9DINO